MFNETLRGIHKAFSQTAEGQILAGNARFNVFRPPETTPQEWGHLLGADVNNLEHMALTRGLVHWFCTHCPGQFSPEEQGDLELAATFHDWAEAVIGDIPAPLKKRQDIKEESLVLKEMVAEFCEAHPEYANLGSRMIPLVDKVIFNKTTKLGRAFNAIENLGYVRTGLIAWAKAPETNSLLRDKLTLLAQRVMIYDLPKLEAYAPHFPAINAFLMLPAIQVRLAEIQATIIQST